MGNVIFFRRKKIKRKQFRKRINLLNKTFETQLMLMTGKRIYKNLIFYKKYLTELENNSSTLYKRPVLLIAISQNKFNPKCTLFKTKNLNTFSVGSIIKYFKVKQAKYIRRSLKGLKIFLNFLKTILERKILKKNNDYIVFSVSGVDYNLVSLKKHIKNVIKGTSLGDLLFLINIKISFTKKKQKKIKAIKKRLRKKIVSTFVKNTV